MPTESKVFRTVRWQILAAGGFALGCAAWLAVLVRDRSGLVSIAVCALLTAGALAAFAHAATTRIVLRPDGLEVVANFRRRFLPRASLETVVWERSSGVSVRHSGGQWLKLPETGHASQVRANAIRAWLKHPPAAVGGARRRGER